MKKKGFVFIETLIVTTILTISLLAIYSNYSALIIKEKERINYNDSAYLYRTYYTLKFFKNFDLYKLKNYISNTGYTEIGCANPSVGNEIYGNINNNIISLEAKKNIATCESLITTLNIAHIYFTFNDLGYLQDCTNFEGKCIIFSTLSEKAAKYIKTLGGRSKTLEDAKNKDEYRLIIEYKEQKNGRTCEEDTECESYFATISIGELNE